LIQSNSSPTYRLACRAHGALVGAVVGAVTFRLFAACVAAWRADVEPFVAFGFGAVFPAVLFALLMQLPPTRSPEGVLMRIGTAAQLILIICFPSWGLLLLLGLPVTFLVVEIFETKAPLKVRAFARRVMVSP
jgi:hypothetical protein